ncbi:LacI family DNA-binding transcriptional regulator [Cellulomonas terrae]|uniref:Transcriptional regulator n=1 Tax=Cellulomonas terrae TaxID=311234 RepID=A0A511JPL1_9CELL|nr:substrate-binding domain-containing protein [Cellulomonas terrae]GEL99972.1 transcriptional regulator [Cellulomonas terrae]
MTERRKPTLADVARVAGVSPATASKALNGRSDVAATTRGRVLAAVEELGYRTGTSPVRGTSRRALAVVFDLPASPYILNVLQGVLASATDAHLDLLTRLAPARATRTQRATAQAWVADQRSAGAVGIVGLTLSEPDALLAAAADAGLPFVMVDPVDARHRPMTSVRSSNWAGARAATDHLIALGHRRIAWVGGPDASAPARDRFYGYRAALESAGIELDPRLVRSDRFDVDAGVRHARDLLTQALPPTAIMAADDEIAVGVLAAAHELGVQVPSRLSVMGFDDTPQAAWTTPALTTVRQDLDGMGRLAVQTVLALSSGEHPPSRHIELATSLTVRDTTGPAPRHGATTPAA